MPIRKKKNRKNSDAVHRSLRDTDITLAKSYEKKKRYVITETCSSIPAG